MNCGAPIPGDGVPTSPPASAPDWKDAMLASKVVEALELRRMLRDLERASLQFLGQPFSPSCREGLRRQIDTMRREIQALDLATAPPLQLPRDGSAPLSRLPGGRTIVGDQAAVAAPPAGSPQPREPE